MICPCNLNSASSACSLSKIVGPQAREGDEPAVTQTLGQHRGEAPGLGRGGAPVEFLALVHIEEDAGQRLALALLQFLLGGVDQLGERVVAAPQPFRPFARQRRLVGVSGVEKPQAGGGGGDGREQRLARPRGKVHPRPPVRKPSGPGCFSLRARPAHGLERRRHAGLGHRGLPTPHAPIRIGRELALKLADVQSARMSRSAGCGHEVVRSSSPLCVCNLDKSWLTC